MNILRNRAWNCISKTNWDEALYKFGYVRFGKYDDNDNDDNDTSYSATTDEYVDDEPINENFFSNLKPRVSSRFPRKLNTSGK